MASGGVPGPSGGAAFTMGKSQAVVRATMDSVQAKLLALQSAEADKRAAAERVAADRHVALLRPIANESLQALARANHVFGHLESGGSASTAELGVVLKGLVGAVNTLVEHHGAASTELAAALDQLAALTGQLG